MQMDEFIEAVVNRVHQKYPDRKIGYAKFLPKYILKYIVRLIFNMIIERIVDGDCVRIRNFGEFRRLSVKPRVCHSTRGVSPHTYRVPPRSRLVFRAYKRVNDGVTALCKGKPF